MDDGVDDRTRLYERTRDDLLKRQLSNSENFDKSILTLSTAALAISLTFIRYVVPFKTAVHTWILEASWLLFVGAIVTTLSSFLLSQRAIKTQLVYAERYYLNGKHEFLTRRSLSARLTDLASVVSATLFVLAIIGLVIFVSFNTVRTTT